MNDIGRREFVFVVRPQKGGQRFFKTRRVGTERNEFTGELKEFATVPGDDIYVCDESGPTPDHTSDGPLKILQDQGLTIYEYNGRVGVEVGVFVERAGREGSVHLSPVEAEWLLKNMKMEVKLARDGAAQLLALGNLFRAWASK